MAIDRDAAGGTALRVDWAALSGSQSTGSRLAADLGRMIRDGALVAGDRIPAERELAELVGMSRASVREALRELELRGMLDRRPGRGTVVTDAPRPELDGGLFGPLDDASRLLREVMDLRGVVEPPIAERAAARGTSAEVEHLRDLIEASEVEAAGGQDAYRRYVELDVEFHLALARMTHNPLLDRLLVVTNEWMAPTRQNALQSARRVESSLAAHKLIYDAVAAREPARAADEMREHLDQIQRIILTGSR